MTYTTYKIYFFIPLILVSSVIAENTSPISTNGYMHFDLSSLYRRPNDTIKTFLTNSINMLTVNMRTTSFKKAKIESLLDFYNVYGYYRDLYKMHKGADEGISYGNSAFFFDVLMLYGSIYLPWFDFTFGRQIINLGNGKLFSPLNIYSTVDIFDISFKRKGKDIIMAAIPLGDLSGIDVATEIPISEKLPHLSSLKFFTNIYGWQFILAGLYRHHTEDIAVGFSVKGDVIAGIYSEAIINYNRLEKKYNYEVMCGVDYSIQRKLIFAAEYYFKNKTESLSFLDRHNIFFSASYSLNELMNTSFYLIESVSSKNLIATFQYTWNLLEGVTTIFFLRYYHLENFYFSFPDGEVGMRIEIKF